MNRCLGIRPFLALAATLGAGTVSFLAPQSPPVPDLPDTLSESEPPDLGMPGSLYCIRAVPTPVSPGFRRDGQYFESKFWTVVKDPSERILTEPRLTCVPVGAPDFEKRIGLLEISNPELLPEKPKPYDQDAMIADLSTQILDLHNTLERKERQIELNTADYQHVAADNLKISGERNALEERVTALTEEIDANNAAALAIAEKYDLQQRDISPAAILHWLDARIVVLSTPPPVPTPVVETAATAATAEITTETAPVPVPIVDAAPDAPAADATPKPPKPPKP